MDVTAATTLFAWMEREVWLVTSAAGGRRGGLIATFVSQASIVLDMPRIMVGLSRRHHTWQLVQDSGVFALHLLSADNTDLVWRFATASGRDADKFADLPTSVSASGCPVVPGTVGWLDCRVEASLDVGDRTLYVAEVVEGQVTNFAPPLTSSKLMELASPSQLNRLQRDRHDDSHHDAEAITRWRLRGKG